MLLLHFFFHKKNIETGIAAKKLARTKEYFIFTSDNPQNYKKQDYHNSRWKFFTKIKHKLILNYIFGKIKEYI